MPTPSSTARRLVAGGLVVGALLAGTACSSDDSTTSGPTTTSPEQKISSDADVAAGLAKMKVSATAVASATDAAAAKRADEELEPVWSKIEGTVKQNEPEIYTEVEDAMSELGSGDTAKAAIGERDLATAADAYLAKHPG